MHRMFAQGGKICRHLARRVPLLGSIYHYLFSFFGAVAYGFPSRKLMVIGVTGTKGKTTALEILGGILDRAGIPHALMTSLEIKIGATRERNRLDMTMPGRLALQRFLARAARAGCRVAAIEVTSEGVRQHRHRHIRWSAGLLLNLAPEHIESHGSFSRYRAAKLAFLEYVGWHGGTVALRAAGEERKFFTRALHKKGITPHFFSPALLEGYQLSPFLRTSFNKENAAAAVYLARIAGAGAGAIRETLRNFQGVQGRVSYILRDPFRVVIDYAHTPDSLEKMYVHLREELPRGKKLICVLGAAGGGRDRWKRKEFGAIAGRFCDRIFLTDEDPYDEDPRSIVAAIEEGIPRAKRHCVTVLLDRRAAILEAVRCAKAGDTVVMTGKGSELWIHGPQGKRIPWDEEETARAAIAARVKKESP
ncbi:hypothetical protein D6833_03865 [Candidatus Parcubacteria bacterium]|nr:MAG: hypothetical protein D6833_03865 [Candidatus Parcubacteria bacterium]